MSSDALEGFEAVAKHTGGPAETPAEPMVSITESGQRLRLLRTCNNDLGRPEAVRCFVDGDEVAIVPSAEDHPHSYSLTNMSTNSGGTISSGWLTYELDSGHPEPGRYEAEIEDGMAIVDFGSGPDE